MLRSPGNREFTWYLSMDGNPRQHRLQPPLSILPGIPSPETSPAGLEHNRQFQVVSSQVAPVL